MPSLTADQLHTLRKAIETRDHSAVTYALPPHLQREVWRSEQAQNQQAGLTLLDQDRWLLDVVSMLDAIDASAPIYLLADATLTPADAAYLADAELRGELEAPRIVVWGENVAFYGGGSAYVFQAGTARYAPYLPGDWPHAVTGLFAISCRPPQRRAVTTNERHALHKARMRPRRELYYVPHVTYEAAPVQPAKGGKHASPVEHDRSAHKALLTRVCVEPEEAADLTARQYTLAWTEELPEYVRERMARRGKQPTPGTLNAYRWIDKPGYHVTGSGERAMKVTVIRDP